MTSETVLKAGDTAPTITLFNMDGQPVNLADTWREKPLLLTFLRHFGCVHCRFMLTQLEKFHPQVAEAGLASVAIGIGQPRHAANFGKRLAPSVTCLTIESNDAHHLYGLKHAGVEQVLNPRMMAATLTALMSGQTQGEATGDITTLGGLFIIDKNGIVRYGAANDYAGDYPKIPDVLAAYAQLPATSPTQ